ncbi:MAG: transporter substrate-binding domain-containing protein [Syntrophales bacterium]|nr:transporter substrate-binding domain-containing protein [Syntrophales bacterium]
MINRQICEEFQQRDKMSDKNPVRSAVSKMLLVTILIFIFVVIIMDSAVAQSQVRSDMIEVTAAVPKNFPPYYFVDESGRPKGFAIDIMDRIAEMVGMRVTYLVEDSWTDAVEAVKSGRADMIPNIGITANRKAYFDYTAAVETFAISIFVRKDTNYIKGVDDLAGHKVAAIKYNIAVTLLQDHEGVDLKVFNDPREAVFELLSGHVDAVLYPAPVFMKIVRDAKVDHSIKIVGKPLKEIKRAIAVSKGNVNLLNRLNGAVNRFVGTNDYQHIYLKWFGKPQPFWTISRVVLTMSGLFLILFTAMALWRYNSIIKLNTTTPVVVVYVG